MNYRIYVVSDRGRLVMGPVFEAAGDAEAIARAPDLLANLELAELWQGGRPVGRFAPDGSFTPGA